MVHPLLGFEDFYIWSSRCGGKPTDGCYCLRSISLRVLAKGGKIGCNVVAIGTAMVWLGCSLTDGYVSCVGFLENSSK